MPAGSAIAVVVLGVAAVTQTVVLLGLMRQVTPLLERVADRDDIGKRLVAQGPAIGSRLPDFAALGVDGEVPDSQLRGQPAVLLFLGVGCGPCQKLAAEMGQSELGELASQLIVVTGTNGQRELGRGDRGDNRRRGSRRTDLGFGRDKGGEAEVPAVRA